MGQAVNLAAFDWYPRWRAAHERLWNPPPPPPSEPKLRPYCPSQWRWQLIEPPPQPKPQWHKPVLIEVYTRRASDDRELITRILRDLPGAPSNKPVMVKAIIAATARHTGLQPCVILGRRRTAPIVRPRQIAMALARELTNMSFPDIGRRFGNRDHTTALWAYNRYVETVRLCICLERKRNGQEP